MGFSPKRSSTPFWHRWRRPEPRSSFPEPSVAGLERAARILELRSRREASGAFLGGYAGAFRGGGVEFEESRPYVPGDDVRSLDWNATARTGEPYVKHFREERDQTVWLALDASRSMGFGTTGRTKAVTAAHAIALLAAAAGRAGDRVGLLTFDEVVRAELGPAKGTAHTWRVIDGALRAGGVAAGGTRLAAACEALSERASRPSVIIFVSDFRDPALLDAAPLPALTQICDRHDVVSMVVGDPREEVLPDVGRVRVADLEFPARTRLLDTSSSQVRERYARIAAARRRALLRRLRGLGSDVVWLGAERDPLQPMLQFFRERASRANRVA